MPFLISVNGEELHCKALTKILLERIKDTIDNVLRDEQAGFKKGRFCADQIATLKIIVEQSIEWQFPLYTPFIDFEKAFDIVDRESIWNMLFYYGVSVKFVDIIKALDNVTLLTKSFILDKITFSVQIICRLYEGFPCQIIHVKKLSKSFKISSGVRQGCLLSPLLFLVVLDWVTKKTYGNSG